MFGRWRGMRVRNDAGPDGNQVGLSIRCCWVAIGWMLLLGAVVPSAAAGQFEVLVASLEASPDGNGQLLTFTPPALNDAGQVAFLSQLVGTENPPDDGIGLFRANTAGSTAIARQGVAMLGDDLLTSFINNMPSINNAGTVAHSGEPAGAPGQWVPFLGNGGPLDTYLEVGSASPAGNNVLVSHSIPVINGAGAAAYRAFYTGSNTEVGIYSRASNGLTTLRLAQGVPAPRGGTIASLTASFPTHNEAGQIALIASVDDGLFTRKSAIRLDGTTPLELARDGDLLGDGITTIGNILSNAVPLNDAGQLAFQATFTQPSVSLRQGVFRADEGGTMLLASGILPGAATLATNLFVTHINNTGQVAFTTGFVGGGSGIYLAADGGPTLVALEDTPTPGGDRFFRRFMPEAVALNDLGQVVFLAELSTTIDGPLAGRGLFRYDPTTGLEQILRTGQPFEGDTLASLNFVGDFYTADQTPGARQAPDPTFSGLNQGGQVAFTFSLTSGFGGIALWSPDAVALPGDYNGDGSVDAGDYVRWRNHLGDPDESGINNNGDGGGVTITDYAWWKQHYGTPGSGAGGGGLVARPAGDSPTTPGAAPEPGAWLLLALGMVPVLAVHPRRTARFDPL